MSFAAEKSAPKVCRCLGGVGSLLEGESMALSKPWRCTHTQAVHALSSLVFQKIFLPLSLQKKQAQVTELETAEMTSAVPALLRLFAPIGNDGTNPGPLESSAGRCLVPFVCAEEHGIFANVAEEMGEVLGRSPFKPLTSAFGTLFLYQPHSSQHAPLPCTHPKAIDPNAITVMAKRKFIEDDREDSQGSDDDFVPSSREDGNERPSSRSLRTSQARSRNTASGRQNRDGEEAQEGASDGGADKTPGDNTSAAPRQAAAKFSQVQSGDQNDSDEVQTGRVRKTGKTSQCGVFSERKKEPEKAKRRGGKFFCIICGSGFTRAEGVNYHFAGCASKHGNPKANHWYDHPSCASRRPQERRDEAAGPSHRAEEPPTKRLKMVLRSTSSSEAVGTTQARPAAQGDAFPNRSRASRPKTSKPEPEAKTSTRGTKPLPRSTQMGSKLLQTKPAQRQPGPRPDESRKEKTKSKETSSTAKPASADKFHLDESHPPLFKLPAIFHDMVVNAWTKTPLKDTLETLSKKQIHIATMCSGTESPLLALDIIKEDLRRSGKPALNIKHLFSAEIVPYKQAYIERNFHPNKLFRDIREIAAGGKATTAYGTLTDVPSDVDILVAGFSCVDFSKLNKHTKTLADVGESGDTFRAIFQYAKRYRPAIIILENVDGAPWNLIEAIWKDDREIIRKETKGGFEDYWLSGEVPYSAGWVRADAKNYYIPQTRIRRYMICIDPLRFASFDEADQAVLDWKTYMVQLQQRASASVEAFLLVEDDPRLQYAKDEMSKTGKMRRETDWELCIGRHEDYRTREELGTSRPILNWTNNGCAKASSYLWTDWSLSQVERIWDTFDISYLRNAAKGMDSFYKSRFWELSQNVDRFLDTTPEGVIGCLTPKGQQFSTIRGRPVTGLEAIALQGLPIDTLLLTRENQRELIDLGGNAMTSTAVGAALLSGLMATRNVLTRPLGLTSQPLSRSSPVSTGMRFSELREKQALNFDGHSALSPERIIKMAKASFRLCRCEGLSLTASTPIRRCKSCNHHCCEKCGNMPKHDYVPFGANGAPVRTDPQRFRKQVERALPTRLEIHGFTPKSLENFAKLVPDRSEQEWSIFCRAILVAFKHEFRFESVKRGHYWTITYKAPNSRLELVFDRDAVYWLLYGQPSESEAGNSPVRKLLAQPLARLTVRGRNMRGDQIDALDLITGFWEIRLPTHRTFSIIVTPQGEMTDSWEKKLGLQSDKFVEKQVFTSLHVARTSDSVAGRVLGHELCGDYDLLENCATACSSLHKKRPTGDSRGAPSLFLFLDADRNGPPDQDSYIFSTEIQRLEYGENRHVAAKIDSQWRPPYKTSDSKAELTASPEVECTIFGHWAPCFLNLRPYHGLEPCFLNLGPHHGSEQASLRFPKNQLSMPVFGIHSNPAHASVNGVYGCLHETATTALVSCAIPAQVADSIGWRVGHWTVLDQRSERQVAAMFAWLFARVRNLGGFQSGWRALDSPPSDYQRCLVCAPEPPRIMWTCSRGGKQDKIVPYEDGREAGYFERMIKARPAPFLVKSRIDNDRKRTGRLLVGLHLPTLVHRALARLGNIADSDDIDLKWRLNTRWEAPTRYRLQEFTLTNNKLTQQAQYAFPTGEQLRPEQKRSLHWMIGQEADDMAFYEEEIEEAVLSQLSWRAEVRVRRTQIVRGGILADEVGYGKTATTLALIDAQKQGAEDYVRYDKSGCISIKATLILVPPHLIYQWTGQTRKFLGINPDDERLLVIESMVQLAKISVERMKKAIIVLISWQVLSSPAYMTRMSHFAALPMGPSSGAREIEAWLSRACENIEKHTAELVGKSKSPKDFAQILKQRMRAAYNDETILRDIPTQRLKGARYRSWNPSELVKPVDSSPKEEDLDKFFKHMTVTGCENSDSLTGILLHMFDFYRVVVDEYTYVDDNQQVDKLSTFLTTIKARSRWVLSGTPSIQDFGDVQDLARFLGCNLGTVDDATGVIKGATIKHIRDHRTAAEQFRAFGFSHTAAWHISRQAYAQEFLDKYASKNVPEIGHIKSLVHLCPHFLGVGETVPNTELQQQLQSTNMQIVLQGKTKKDNDRYRRLQTLLKGCKTASECLIKACSISRLRDPPTAQSRLSGDPMDLDDSDAAESEYAEQGDEPSKTATLMSGTCQFLITVRQREMDALVVELEHNLLHAAWLELQCRRALRVEYRGDHFRRWKSDIETVGLSDPRATASLRHYLIQALENVHDSDEDQFYRDAPSAEKLKKEKEASDVRKKQKKAKKKADKKKLREKEAAQKRKAFRKLRAIASPDEDDAGSDSDSEGDDMDPNQSDPLPDKIPRDDFKKLASDLRKVTSRLRGLIAEFISRTRSLRFARGAQELQQWYASKNYALDCEACGKVIIDPADLSINIRCGHLTCAECIQSTGLAICAVNGCAEDSGSFRLRKAVDLAGDGKTWDYGSRLGNIIELINSLPDDEQVLLFVQSEDVMLTMSEGLEKAGIPNYALTKSAGRLVFEMMNDFQDNDGEEKKKVLLLNPSSEIASGINLTNANHVIFASPLLTQTQASYDAMMTQSIGRAKRFGQQKTVHIYRFVALRTADVDILQEREQMTLVKRKVSGNDEAAVGDGPGTGQATTEWLLVSEDTMDESMEAGWGSGYDFKSNPTAEDD